LSICLPTYMYANLYEQTRFSYYDIVTTQMRGHHLGTPRYFDRLCSDRRYSDSAQSGRRVADFSWIGLRAVPIGKTPNQIPKIRGLLSPIMGLAFQNFGTKVWKARPNIHWAQIASVPRLVPCFRCMQHLDHRRRNRGQGGHVPPKIPENIFLGQLLCKIRAFSGKKSCKNREFC